MDRGSLTQVALYVGFCCAAATELFLSPSQPRCVFVAYDKVTCHWTPGKDSPSDTVYTFQANLTHFGPTCDSTAKRFFNCANVTRTNCSISITTPARQFSFRVVSLSSVGTASSPTLCINGTDAVKLRRPDLFDLKPVEDKPGCLELWWKKPTRFALTNDEICSDMKYQLQYSTDDQPAAQTEEGRLQEQLQPEECRSSLRRHKTVRLGLCSLNPFTLYSVRLRQRYLSVWSEWSRPLLNCTETAAPITAPELWRTIKPTDVPHQRQVTLLWKFPPKSQTTCTSLWFNVSCWSEKSQNALQTWSYLNVTNTSCQLILPVERCSCSLTMSNPAGTSPPAWVFFPSSTDTVLSTMKTIRVKELDDSRLEVRWSSVKQPSLTGFLVEWVSASEIANHNLNWDRMSPEASHRIITDLLPEVCYCVTVTPEFGNKTGMAISTKSYTRQGVPSTGPKLNVVEQSSGAILLKWEPLSVEQRRGFITQYSLYCQKEDNTTGKVHWVTGETLHHRLTGLSGVYQIYITAHTVAGKGRAGPTLWVTVEENDSVRTILVCVIPTLVTTLMFLVIIPWRQRIRQRIWPRVPDPSLSNLTAWISQTPKHTRKKLYSGGVEQTSTCRLADAMHDEQNGYTTCFQYE